VPKQELRLSIIDEVLSFLTCNRVPAQKNIPKILDFTQNILTLQYGRSQKGLNNGLRVKLTVAIDSPPQNT
jgi:hypothetical protein